MAWLLYLFLTLLAMVLYLLLAPFYLEINSILGLYRIRFHRIVSASLKSNNGYLFLDVRFFGLSRNVSLTKSLNAKEAKPKAPKKSGRSGNKMPFRKIIGMLRTFQILRCIWKFDTGDNQVNGLLFPVFWWLGKISKHEFQVTFSGENVLILEIKNNVVRALWGYFKS